MEKYIDLILAVLTGLIMAIPLVYNLVKYVGKSIKAKNWGSLLQLVMGYMAQAETMFATGTERKKWVMIMIAQSAASINYEIDMDAVSTLIDRLSDLTKVVNVDR